ncbi:hypothetical protein [Salinigranum salinum]|uniref:hypothetical protein n=1 Tax=Salinigranum salinum TaxID=1364937 RepID=UPI001260889C|nr:hypothetical protein [Salinigranum salinum]
MLAIAWTRPEPTYPSWGVTRILVRSVLEGANIPPQVFFYVPTGFVVGLSLVLLFDDFKRRQGIIVLVGMLLLSVLVLVPFGVLIGPLLSGFTLAGGLLGLVALGVGLAVGGLRPKHFALPERGEIHRDRSWSILNPKQRPLEFDTAPRLLLEIAFWACVVGFIDAHVIYDPPIRATGNGLLVSMMASGPFSIPEPFVVEQVVIGQWGLLHLAGIVMLLLGLDALRIYEVNRNVLMLGPARSGKSAAFGGLHEALDRFEESNTMQWQGDALRDAISEGRFPDPNEVGRFEGAAGTRYLHMPYVWGKLFPKRVSFDTVDYPGESLERILRPFYDDPGPGATNTNPYGLSVLGQAAATDGGRTTSGETERSGVDQGGEDAEVIDEDEDDPGRSQRDPHQTETSQYSTSYTPAGSWDDAVYGLKTELGSADPEMTTVIQRISDMVYYADTLILVVPLDDFIVPIAARGNEPSYVEVYDEDEVTFGSDVVTATTEVDGERISTEYTDVEFQRRFTALRYQGKSYYSRRPETRARPNQYLDWYRSLVSVFGGDKTFVMVPTMSDLAVDDMRAAEGNSRIDPGRRDVYPDFAAHIEDEVLKKQSQKVDQVIGEPHIPGLYPIWYTIVDDRAPEDDDEDLSIDTSVRPTILNGAEQLLKKVNW